MIEEICPDCNGKLRFDSEETYCIKCGLVIDDMPIDFGKDDYDNTESRGKQTRTGMPITYLNPWLWTKIPYLRK